MDNFEGKTLSELKEILKTLRLYKNLKEKLGKRGEKLFKSITKKTPIYKIEYFDSLGEKEALEEGLKAYKKAFNIEPKKEEVELVSKKSLQGGIRIYKDDNLVDMSFKKASEALK